MGGLLGKGPRGHGPALRLVPAFPTQAWLTEIQEYAQQDVVLMLLGNKVGTWAVLSSLAPQGKPWTAINKICVRARLTLPKNVQ